MPTPLPQSPTVAPSFAREADPQVFFSSMLAGLCVSAIPKGDKAITWIQHCKEGWFAFKQLVEWVNEGEDVRERKAVEEKERLRREHLAEVERLDREAAERRHAAAVAAHGAK